MQRGTGAKAAGTAKAIGKTPLIVGSSALSRASPFSGPQIAHKVTKTQLFCKACSFSPEFACSEAHGFCPAKSFFSWRQPALPVAGLFSLSQATHCFGWGKKQPSFSKNKTNPHQQTNKHKKTPKQPRKPPNEFLFLCLRLPAISTEPKLFPRAPQDLLSASVPRASLSQLTDGAFPNLLPH